MALAAFGFVARIFGKRVSILVFSMGIDSGIEDHMKGRKESNVRNVSEIEIKQRTDETKLPLSLDESQRNTNDASPEVEILNLRMSYGV
jgi:hypothetical protein